MKSDQTDNARHSVYSQLIQIMSQHQRIATSKHGLSYLRISKGSLPIVNVDISIIFEGGLRTLESFSLDLRRYYDNRVGAPVPRIVFFRPTAPPYYLSVGFGPWNHFLRIFDTPMLFKCGRWSIESLSSDFRYLHIIRVWALVPRVAFVRPAAPSYSSSAGFGS
jgi:hypothetical protein